MKILAIGDTHFPFSNDQVIRWIIYTVLRDNPDITHVVQLGDLYDFASYGRFPKRMFMTPKNETTQAKHKAECMWEAINRVSPESKKYQLLGNHDARLSKRVIELTPEFEHLIRYKDLWAFPGVTTVADERDELVIGDWAFIHGHTKFTKHIEAVDFKNVCTGHLHRGGHHTYRMKIRGEIKILEELNAGYCGDPFHEALIYRPLNRFFNWTAGCALIDKDGGRFIPYPGKEQRPGRENYGSKA